MKRMGVHRNAVGHFRIVVRHCKITRLSTALETAERYTREPSFFKEVINEILTDWYCESRWNEIDQDVKNNKVPYQICRAFNARTL